MPPRNGIPRFQLYGERERSREPEFLHVETIFSRSHLYDWTIRPHRHDDLVQFLFVSQGGGTLTLDGQAVAIDPPWLVALPPTVVHGFAFVPDTQGYVLTVSEDFFFLACDPGSGLAAILAQPLILRPGAAAADEIAALFRRIFDEFEGSRPRRTEAIAACIKLLAVAVDRTRAATVEAGQAPAHPGKVSYVRFRHLVEERWREHRAIDHYATELGTTPARLNAGCKEASGLTASQIIRQRVLLEAKRNLIYTAMSVSEIAYELGFSEPAYFSRFFRKSTGQTPRDFRLARSMRQ